MSEADQQIKFYAMKKYGDLVKEKGADDIERSLCVTGFAAGWDAHQSDTYDRYVKLTQLLQRRGYTDIEVREIIEGE